MKFDRVTCAEENHDFLGFSFMKKCIEKSKFLVSIDYDISLIKPFYSGLYLLIVYTNVDRLPKR